MRPKLELSGTSAGRTAANTAAVVLNRRARNLPDRAAELARVLEIDRFNRPDRLRRDIADAHRAAQTDSRDDRELGRGVGAVDVLGRIGLGVAGRLRFGERVGKRSSSDCMRLRM